LAFILFATLLSAAISGTVGSLSPDPQQYLPALDALQAEAVNHLGHWDDTVWQAALRTQLAHNKIDAVLHDAAGTEIFRSHQTTPTLPYRRIVLIQDNQLVGTISLYVAALESDQWLNSMAPALVIINQLALFIVLSWLVSRYLLNPLAA